MVSRTNKDGGQTLLDETITLFGLLLIYGLPIGAVTALLVHFVEKD
jgi:hypothetical protein